MKHAQIILTEECLREVMAIPQNVYITGVRHDPFTNRFSIALTGDGLPDGCISDGSSEPKSLIPTYSRDEGEVISGVCWKA